MYSYMYVYIYVYINIVVRIYDVWFFLIKKKYEIFI